MNYVRIYNNLIKNAWYLQELRNVNSNNVYYEKHHIVPRCLKGPDSDFNIVKLTAREHFIAHALLVKIYPTDKKITNAFICMKQNKSGERYINARLYEQLKKYWIRTHSGEKHHLYNKGHSTEAKAKMSCAKKGTMPVKDSSGNMFCVNTDDPRVLSGMLVHVTAGRKMTESELKNHKELRQGFSNPNANSLTDKEIVNHGVRFYEQHKIWKRADWNSYCKENGIPFSYTKMRFDGKGYNELLRRIEEITGPMRKFQKKDYANAISETLRKKNRKWYYRLDTKETKLLTPEQTNENWILGRKLKWD